MNRQALIAQIRQKNSFLCVGLDPDLEKLPKHLPKNADGILAFNKEIIKATSAYAVAFKPNLAFYEAHGKLGWEVLEETIKFIPKNCFTIADAKRGDIGNTGKFYAQTFLENLNFDSITVAPYMGGDSIKPFLTFDDKWAIVLALTSNEGAFDFQLADKENPLFETVITKCQTYGSPENLMFVIGATKGSLIKRARELAPHNFFLVPGVGAQGGSLKEVYELGANQDVGLLVNASRSILYASSGEDFAEAAAKEAHKMQQEMRLLVG